MTHEPDEDRRHSAIDERVNRPGVGDSLATASFRQPPAESATGPVSGGELPATQCGLLGAATVEAEADRAQSSELPSYFSRQPARALEPGQSVASATGPTWAGYEILGELGRGGMGVVYRARQSGLGRIVALKMLLGGVHAGPHYLTRFDTEARAVASLQHPNIVQIYEVGQHDGLPFFSLEFVDGGSLAHQIDGKPQPPAYAAKIVELLARGMQYAHERGVVHRDLKPANVLLTSDGQPKIGDFGLAKRLELDSGQTRTGTVMGSPSYMAPEQARGDVHNVGPLADLYALGATLYELLTGRPPFLGSSAVETVSQVVNHDPVPPTQLQPKLPVDIETICLKCLQKNPQKRYASCLELAEDLRRFQAGEPIRARPVGAAERLWRWCRRNPRMASASALAIVFLITTVVVLLGSTIILRAKNKVIADERNNAIQATAVAQHEAANAARQQAIAEEESTKAREAEDLADKNAFLAGRQATEAVLIIQFVAQKVQQLLSEAPATQQIRQEILELANTKLKSVADMVDASTSKEATQLAIHKELGLLYAQIGKTAQAKHQLDRAEPIARYRVELKKSSDSSRSNLAVVLRLHGQFSQEIGRDMQSVARLYEEALNTRQEILDNPNPGDGNAANPFAIQLALAEDHMRVATTIYRLGDPAGALAHYEKALEWRRDLQATSTTDPNIQQLSAEDRLLYRDLPQDLLRSQLSIGEMRFRLEEPDTALTVYSDVIQSFEQLVQKSPNDRWLKRELASYLGNFGDILLYTGRIDDASLHYERCRSLSEQLVELDAYEAIFKRDLALAHYRLGNCARRRSDQPAADQHYRVCRTIREELADIDPSNDRRRMELMLVLAHCGEHEAAAELAEQYAQHDSADNELLLDVARCFAQCSVAATNVELQDRYAAKAIDALTRAFDQEYRDIVYIRSEPDLDPLRGKAGFESLKKR